MIAYDDFFKVQICVGTIIKAEENDTLKKPSIVLTIDFGEKVGFSTGPTGPGHPSGRGSRRGQALKVLYLGDYWELVGQTVHGGVSAQPSPVVGNVSGALRGAWSLP